MSATDAVVQGGAGVSLRRTMFRLTPWNLAVQAFSFASAVALARVLGASVSTDAYYLGLSVPVLTYGILMGALRSGGIPALTDVAASGEAALERAANEIVSGVLVASCALALVVTAASELLMPLIVGGRLLDLTRMTLLELAPYAVFGATTGILTALLNVRGAFAVPVAVLMLEPLLKTALTFSLGREIGIQALIIGNLVGGGIATAVLWLWVGRRGIRLRLVRNFSSPFVRRTVRLSIPLIASSSLLLVNPLVDRTMASSLGAGNITSLELGLRLSFVPAGFVTGLLIGPVTAAWAARLGKGGWSALRASTTRAIGGAAAVLPPLIVLGVLLRHEIVTVIFEGGEYSASALHKTGSVFGMIMLGLPAQMLIVFFSALFIVQKDTIFPMKVAGLNVGLNIALNFAFRPLFGVAGIALSTSLTYTILLAIYAYVAYRRWGSFYAGRVWPLLSRLIVTAAAMVGACLAVVAALPAADSRSEALLVAVVVTAVGLLIHMGVSAVGRDPLALVAVSQLRRLATRTVQ
jgi:putative peptidoglycan lipid II flippase